MQDLLANLLWQNEEIDEAADRLRRSLPGFPEAEQAYDTLAARLRAAAGPELYDQFYHCFMRYTGWAWVCGESWPGRWGSTPRSSSPSPAWS